MESLKGQFLAHCCLICICSHLGPSFGNTIFHITPMLMIQLYITVSALPYSNEWPHPMHCKYQILDGHTFFTDKWGQNRDSFSRSQGFEAPDSLFVNFPVGKTLWACQKLWGVILDTNLNFQKHISNISKTAFYHPRNTCKVRCFLSQSDSEKLFHAFISNRLDYCNAFFAGTTKQLLNKLQLIQNAAARILTKIKRFEHITPLTSLHRLPVKLRNDLKILLIVFKSMNSLAPFNIVDMLTEYTPD